jgi:hypothetical protein
MFLRFLPFLLIMAFAGCVTAPAPIPPGYTGARAKISDTSTSVSATKVQFFQLEKVDARTVLSSSMATYQKNYGHGFAMDPVLESREVPAQTCVLSIAGTTHVAADILAFGGGMYHVEGDVTASLQPDKTYFVKGTLAKEYSAVWLEDSEGHLVSSKIEKNKH